MGTDCGVDDILCGNPSAGRLEKGIAKLYIFCLTMRMISPLLITQSFLHAAATDFDLILHILGFLLIIYRNHWSIYLPAGPETGLLKFFGFVVLWLNVSSVIMACVMQSTYGSIGSDNAFSAISGMVIYWFQYFFIFLYDKEIFLFLTKQEIERILQAEMWGLLILGYVQVAVMSVSSLATIYDRLDVLSVLTNGSIMSKLALTGSEGASAGGIIGIFVVPFLLSGILNKERRKIEVMQLILWLPLLYYTNSSTAFLATLSAVPALLIIAIKRGLMTRKGLIITIIMLVVAACAYLAKDEILSLFPEKVADRINYLVFEKAADQGNGSTVSRTVPLITNWGAFTEYPLLGVGNGCQGYFYTKYFPTWAMNIAGSDVMTFYYGAEHEIVNGAVFFPSILSGYGIVGTILVLVYIVNSHRVLRNKSGQIGRFADYYYLALLPILLYGFQGELAGEYYIWFLLSIPYMVPDCTEAEDEQSEYNGDHSDDEPSEYAEGNDRQLSDF